MHKSVIYLLGLLVILMPIGTSMNAMGIAENEYYTDKYMGYANDMVNEYEDESSYANDGYESDRSYGNDNYDREYPSYKPDYKSDYNEEYKSYENNDYKSKDKERNSVSISNINCNTANFNFVNNNVGNLSIGNSGIGGAADDGTNGALSANANNEGSYDRYQKGKDITCISNINNNNTNIATGNETDGGNVILTCEECFTEFLTEDQLDFVLLFFTDEGQLTLGEFCLRLLSGEIEIEDFFQALDSAGVSTDVATNVVQCLENAGVVFQESAGGLSNLPTAPSLGLP